MSWFNVYQENRIMFFSMESDSKLLYNKQITITTSYFKDNKKTLLDFVIDIVIDENEIC